MLFNNKEYDFVIHKKSKMKFVVKRIDTPYNQWDNHLDEKIMCYPYENDEIILGEREYLRREIDRVWIQFI